MKIGFIGGGNMGSAIIAGIYKTHKICVCEADKKKAAALKRKYKVCLCDIACIAQGCDVIILAVKPQGMAEVLEVLSSSLRRDVLVVSIAAGITTRFLEKNLPPKTRVIRTMPNMPAQVGQGMTGITKGRNATDKDVKGAAKIFDQVGKTLVMDEKMLDALTAVSGSGPAYVFYFLECMVGAARSVGFSQEQAIMLVRQTVSGSFHLMAELKECPLELRKKVTSKGGTTEAAMKVFEAAKTAKIFKDAMMAAKKRGRELAQ
jgi:pyrroline-5-carboxylate reductase